MNPETLKLLSPSAIDIENPGGGFARLTAADVSAALSGLSKGPMSLGMILHAHDERSFYSLYIAVIDTIPAPKKPAELKGVAPIRNLLWTALCELFLANLCKACGGTGRILDATTDKSCDTCGGKCTKQYTELSRARQSGIAYELWKSFYSDYYRRLTITLLDWESRIQPHITRRYGDG